MKTLFLYLRSLVIIAYLLGKAGARRRKNGIVGFVRFLLYWMGEVGFVTLSLALLGDRALIFACLFTWFREVDDVLDGDAPTSPRYSSWEHCVERKEFIIRATRAFGEISWQEDYREDTLLATALFLAKKHRLVLGEHIYQVWQCMLFDAKRQRHELKVERGILDSHATTQDLTTLELAVTVLGGNVSAWRGGTHVIGGVFTWIDWLADIQEDLRRGLVNIPKEDIERSKFSFTIWFKKETARVRKVWQDVWNLHEGNFCNIFDDSVFLTHLFGVVLFRRFEAKLSRIEKNIAHAEANQPQQPHE